MAGHDRWTDAQETLMLAAQSTLREIERARERIAGIAIRSPLVPLHDEGSPGTFLKLENLQPTGAFKVRGATNLVVQLSDEVLREGLFTASAGNMGQAVAWSARRLGVSCSVVVPDTAPSNKTDAVERLGGTVIRVAFDRWWQVFTEKRFEGLTGTFVHPFADQRVMDGNGTIGLELLEDLPTVGVVLIPWGGGGLACGIAAAIRASGSACRIYACEVAGAAPLSASRAAGRPVESPYERSFVDGIGSKDVLPDMFDLASELLDGVMIASVQECESAVATLFRRNRIVVEGAGACPVAVARSGRVSGGPIACVVSGGNIDAEILSDILARNQEAGRALPQ
jgi:threonine dehydratase